MMDIQKECNREAFEKYAASRCYYLNKNSDDSYCKANTALAWEIWREASAIPDGFVLVPMANISAFYQDDDEPENFANLDDGVSALGDCCDLDDIVAINKIEQAHISTEKMWGAFKIVDSTSSFTLFNNELDAIAARDKTVAHYMEVHV